MSKLKTVWDAINELKGDLNNTYLLDINNDVYLFHCIIDGDYVCSPSETETDDTQEYICTQKEFNALVEEMTLGLDVNPVNHGHYLNYVYADKTPLEKEALDSIVNNTSRFSVLGGDIYLVESWLPKIPSGYYEEVKSKMFLRADMDKNDIDGGYLFRIDDCSDALKLTNTNTVNKPLVYTQEMADNGELLSVGMKAFLRGFQREILLGPDSDGDYITMNGEGSYDFDSANQFKPIDTRTKKEKAIDEIFNNRVWDNSIELLGLAYDDWVGE